MKKLAIGVLALSAAALLAMPVIIAQISVLFLAASTATQNPCVSPVGSVTDAGGPVRLPVVGSFVSTSEYGMRSNPGNIETGQYRMHWGLDLSETPVPAAVVAAKAGVVKEIPDTSGGGHEVYIDHGAGLETGYLHLASRTVKVGQRVWAGKQIGVEGNTGNSSGAHLHFEVKVNGVRVNPRTWLQQSGIAVPTQGATAEAVPVVAIDPGPQPAVSSTPLATTSPPGDTKSVVLNFPGNVGAYKGEQVINAGHIIKTGQARGLDAKTITIGVMTAMGESSLKNVPHGDAVRDDTIGLFQEGKERGPLATRMNPAGASGIFYDYLLKVLNYLTLAPTVAAHKAQANADPYYYAPFWGSAVQMVASLTADPSLLERLPVTGPVRGCEAIGSVDPLPAGNGSSTAIVAAAQHYIGTPYSWGGGNTKGPSLGTYESPSLDGSHTVGFDCSGLVSLAVYNATGIALDHSSESQAHDSRAQSVPRDWTKMQPGDVIGFSEDGSGAPGSFGHIGIYIGGGKMIHAPRPGKKVETVALKGNSYYESMAWSIKRFAPN